MMEKKCDKYESLFIFSDEETLMKHVAECEDCKREHDRMNRVSELIGEVKDEYKKPKRKLVALQVACAMFLFLVGGTSINILDNKYGILDTVRYGDTLTVEDLGFPTDSYGLIQVD